jgi:hypothetical protein
METELSGAFALAGPGTKKDEEHAFPSQTNAQENTNETNKATRQDQLRLI